MTSHFSFLHHPPKHCLCCSGTPALWGLIYRRGSQAQFASLYSHSSSTFWSPTGDSQALLLLAQMSHIITFLPSPSPESVAAFSGYMEKASA